MSPMHTPSVQRWLRDHCESSVQVVGGLVLRAGADQGDEACTVAEWPASGGMTPPLAAAAQAAIQRDRAVVLAPAVSSSAAANHNRVISLPMRHGQRALGAVALAVQADSAKAVEALVDELQAASNGISGILGEPAPLGAADDAARVLRLQGILLSHNTLEAGALALVTELAALIGCERVSLGVVDGDAVEVIAVSNSADVHPEQALQRAMAAAMQEAADQGAHIDYPVRPDQPLRVALAHADLNARCARVLASVPLVRQRHAVGALLAEWSPASAPKGAGLALLDSCAAALGPWVALSRAAERSGTARAADALRSGWQRLARRDDPLPKLALAAALAVIGAALFMPVSYQVGAPAHIEGAVQRVVAAPADGYVHKSHVRPGDVVKAGDLLIELADQDLLLEQRKWESALAQHENGYAAALARADRAQFVITQGRAAEARAQLDLVRQQLARTRLVAPIDGVVIKGDPGQSLGAPVQRGDALLTLAPAEQYRLIVEVDERDVAAVVPGQAGRLALSALPAQPLEFTVDRVTPVATPHDGRNAFEVEAHLGTTLPLLRPGLEGVAKIHAGERSLAWIWGHRALDWLRLALWSWSP
jgi:multidrug efflux pump subunit AcrA (membrane-fusion protein)